MNIGTPASPYYSPFAGGRPTNARQAQSLSNIGTLVTAFLAILATGGPTYSFGVYAATLKANLGLTQSQLETLGAASFAAGFISWIPGLAVDTWGPRRALVVGGAGQCIGFFLYWLVARFAYVHLPSGSWLPILSTLSVLIFTSNNLVIGGVFKSLVVSCGLGTKGSAVGAGKAFLGLGAGVYSCAFKSIQHTAGLSSDLDFLAMSSVSAVTSIMLPAALGLPSRKAVEDFGIWDDSTSQHYTLLYAGLFCLATAVVGTSATAFLFPNHTSHGPQLFPEWLHGILIILLWVGPVLGLFLVPTKRKLESSQKARITQSIHRQKARAAADATPIASERTQLFIPPAASSSKPNELTEREQEEFVEICETPKSVEDRNLIEMLQTVEAWLFLMSATILVGSGTMLTINMGQMVQALGYNKPFATSACLSIFSVSQALARVAAGAISEFALQWPTHSFGIYGVPRTAFLVLSCAFAVGGHASFAVAGYHRGMFVLGICLTGLSFGALWPLMVLIMGDLFGTLNHGANYMFADGFTCAVGTLSIAKFLTQTVYEAHVLESSSECFGEECFRLTHLIVAGLCLCSLLASIILCYTTRSSYGTIR